MSFDPYQILGVTPDAGSQEIQRSYRGLARRYHPDINRSPIAEERFKLLAQAYSVLSDAKRRALFDEFGEASLALGFDPQLARQRGGGRSTSHRRQDGWQSNGADLHHHLEIELATALRGGVVRVASPAGGMLAVKLPAGVKSGHRVRLQGLGRPGRRGQRPGDLYLEVQVKPHPFFRRQGNDLVLDLPVTIEEAHRGAEVDIPTLDGWLRLPIPPDSRGGETLRLRCRGAPGLDGQRGHLYVHLCVRLPDRLEAARRSLERLASLYSEDVRLGLRL